MSSAGRPNLILISIDAVRADALSCYGYQKPTTPFLDSLAEQGVRFTQCFANAPWTPPSHGTMFTGQYPSIHGVRGKAPHLKQGVVTLAEHLKANGYETVAISHNPWLGPLTGLDRGFATFFNPREMPRPWQDPAFFLDYVFDRVRQRLEKSADGKAFLVNRLTNRWIRNRDGQRPYFLFLHYMTAHASYYAPQPFWRRFAQQPDPADLPRLRNVAHQGGYTFMAGQLAMSARDWDCIRSWYDAEVAYLDSRLAQLFRMLKRNGDLQNTLIVITADHGENFGEHGLAYHQFCLYDTLLHVPLIVYGPMLGPAGRAVDDLVSHLDLVPTVLTLAGIPLDGGQYQGHDLLSNAPGHDAVLAEYGPPQAVQVYDRLLPDFDYSRFDRALRSARTTRWKYILASDGQE
jgi:arylsulfatase A-like enzyme